MDSRANDPIHRLKDQHYGRQDTFLSESDIKYPPYSLLWIKCLPEYADNTCRVYQIYVSASAFLSPFPIKLMDASASCASVKQEM